MPPREEREPNPVALRERNTAKMVADHWGCSQEHVYNLIASGTLAALRLGGLIRITREQVEACEAACNTKLEVEAANRAADTMRARTRDPFELGRRIAGRELDQSLPKPRGRGRGK